MKMKFRAWADNKMIYPNPERDEWWYFHSDGSYWTLNTYNNDTDLILCGSLESKNPVLMPSIGKKDIHKKELYVNDFVLCKDDNSRGMIVFNPHCCAYLISIKDEKSITGKVYHNISKDSKLICIGNKYENPKLAKEIL